MILQPTNNALLSSSYSAGNQSYSPEINTQVTSKDLASASSNPSVNVQLSSTRSASIEVPPIYNRPKVPSSFENGLVASKSSTDSDAISASRFSLQKNEGGANKSASESENEEPSISADPNKFQQGATLSEEELKIVEQLKAIDREVRTHEQAHKAVGGQHTGAISYSYQSGPDGKRYAMGGEVPIDVSPVPGDPQATITKMMVVSAAASAPPNPSAQDRAVAAQASRLLAEAQAELLSDRTEARIQLREDQLKSSEERKKNEENAEKQSAYTDGLLSKMEEISRMGEETQALLDAIA